MPKTSADRGRAMRAAEGRAAEQGGLICRRDLYRLGVTRWMVRAQLRARRWQVVTDQVIALQTGELGRQQQLWAAVLHGGTRAQLDAAAALEAEGLERFSVDRIRVTVPKGTRFRRTAAYDVRESRRWSAEDRVPTGPPRTRAEVAAVRAFLWSASDKQATTVLTMAVQQGLTTPERLGEQALRIRRDKRRALLHTVILDLFDGARSLGELQVVEALRARGLPAPDRQVLRRDDRGRYYLDLYWPAYALIVEVDGIHHTWVENVVADALRQNALSLDGDTVLRLPLLGLRLQPDAFFDQIASALRDRGWQPPPDVLPTVA